jgi:hypothetical protein
MRWYGTPDYCSFIDISLREVPIQMISFDTYPLIADDANRHPIPFRNISNTRLKTNWYETLEIIREVSRARKLPFWAFALSTAHRIPGSHLYPTATVAGMKLQQYSNTRLRRAGTPVFHYWQPDPGFWSSMTRRSMRPAR